MRVFLDTLRGTVGFFPSDADPTANRPGWDLARGLSFGLCSLSAAAFTITFLVQVSAALGLTIRVREAIADAISQVAVLAFFLGLLGVFICSSTTPLPAPRHGEEDVHDS